VERSAVARVHFIRVRCQAGNRCAQAGGGVEVEIARGGLDNTDAVPTPCPAARARHGRRPRVARRRAERVVGGGRAAAARGGGGGDGRRARPRQRRPLATRRRDCSPARQSLETTQLLGEAGALEAVTVTTAAVVVVS